MAVGSNTIKQPCAAVSFVQCSGWGPAAPLLLKGNTETQPDKLLALWSLVGCSGWVPAGPACGAWAASIDQLIKPFNCWSLVGCSGWVPAGPACGAWAASASPWRSCTGPQPTMRRCRCVCEAGLVMVAASVEV